MKNWKLAYSCLSLAPLGVGATAISRAANSVSHDSTFAMFETLGYVRITHSEHADGGKFGLAVDQAAAAEKWTQVSMRGHSVDGHERTEYVFRDGAGSEIRMDWVAKDGADAVLLVSGAPATRASATSAIWTKLMPQIMR